MFENIKDFKHIVVSGPQRSGTRIVAKILANDLEKVYIDEDDINYHDFRLLDWYLSNRDNIVIQCPGLCHYLHHIKTSSTLVIVVRRAIEDILSSERRIGWADISKHQELYKYGYSSGIISRVKYEFWDTVQKPILGNMAAEVNYSEIESHPLFIKDRKSFTWDQTK